MSVQHAAGISRDAAAAVAFAIDEFAGTLADLLFPNTPEEEARIRRALVDMADEMAEPYRWVAGP